ncbi:unnamed protein product [Boreogadus saida]
MERRPPESVAPVETPSTSAPTLARHPVDAGLGEQRLTFLGDEDSAEEFKCHILAAYPKLNDCRGFEILKVSGMTRSKNLSVMPCPSTGYTIKSIKNHIKSATIYIRPMQKDIDTTPVEPESVVSGPKEKCLICAEEIFFSELKDHVKHCSLLLQLPPPL